MRPRNLLMLLKSSFLTLFRGVGRGARGLQRPAVCPSLSAVCWVGDELGMSDGLPVWAERLWVAAGLPQGWPDGCYAPHWPGVRCRGFMRICYTHANHTKKNPHTACRCTHTHTYTCENVHWRQAGKRCPDARTAGGKFERRKVGNGKTEAEFVIFDDFNLF